MAALWDGAAVTGAELRADRKAAGLSQIELARHAGVGRHSVQYWETKPRLPDAEG